MQPSTPTPTPTPTLDGSTPAGAELLRDIKPEVTIPAEAADAAVVISPILALIVALAITAMAAALVWVAVAYRRRRRVEPCRLARSLAQIESLRNRPPEDASSADFALAVSLVVRQHIAAVLGVGADRATTEEFLSALAADRSSPLEPHRPALERFLEICDRAKFARGDLDRVRRDEICDAAERLVTQATAAANAAAAEDDSSAPSGHRRRERAGDHRPRGRGGDPRPHPEPA